MKREHMLVMRFSALGDVAMVVPVVYALAKAYPDLRITVLSKAIARPLFERLPPNVGFMEADVKGEYRGMKGLNALYRRLAAKQFTMVADLHSVLRSDYLRMRFKLSRIKLEHINKHRQQRHALVSQKHKQMRQLSTSFENYADVFRRLGYPVDLTLFKSLFSQQQPGGQATTARGDLSLLPPAICTKGEGDVWIGLAPFAAHEGKVYPPQKMAVVIGLLLAKRPQARLFLFGRGPAEDECFARWTSQWSQCTTVGSHCSSLEQELILMSNLDVMVSMDSANMHLASLTATPVVSVWGATHPYAGFYGWNQPADNAVQAEGLDCRPCSIYGQKRCRRGDMACMNQIKPETIVAKIESILK